MSRYLMGCYQSNRMQIERRLVASQWYNSRLSTFIARSLPMGSVDRCIVSQAISPKLLFSLAGNSISISDPDA